MIAQEGRTYRAICDGCGRKLAIEYRKRAAWRAAERVGWKETREGLLCGVCCAAREGDLRCAQDAGAS